MADNYSCLLCGTTTPLPHECPVFLPSSPPGARSEESREQHTALWVCVAVAVTFATFFVFQSLRRQQGLKQMGDDE